MLGGRWALPVLKLPEGRSAEVDALRPLAVAPDGRPVPWLRLDVGEVLLVPKLCALSDRDGFAVELDRALSEAGPTARARWVRRPRPLG